MKILQNACKGVSLSGWALITYTFKVFQIFNISSFCSIFILFWRISSLCTLSKPIRSLIFFSLYDNRFHTTISIITVWKKRQREICTVHWFCYWDLTKMNGKVIFGFWVPDEGISFPCCKKNSLG